MPANPSPATRHPPRLIEAQLRLLLRGGYRPECAVSQLILATWGDVTAPSDAEALALLRLAQRIFGEQFNG